MWDYYPLSTYKKDKQKQLNELFKEYTFIVWIFGQRTISSNSEDLLKTTI